jgi:ferrous iron transport protein A
MLSPTRTIPLHELPLGTSAEIAGIDWSRLRDKEARRLRELGFDEGVGIEALHRGPIGADPIACRVGRMTVAIRRASAAAISVHAQP